jgi:hypothetical protein
MVPHAPPKLSEARLDLDSFTFAAPGHVATVSVAVNKVFRPFGFAPTEEDPLTLEGWLLESLKTSKVENLMGPLVLNDVAHQTVMLLRIRRTGPLVLPTLSPGEVLEVRVKNVSDAPRRMRVACVGLAYDKGGA